MTYDGQVAQLKKLLAHFTKGSLFVDSVDGADFKLKAAGGGEWTENIGATLSALASLRRDPGFAEADAGCRVLVRDLKAQVPMFGPDP